MNRTINSTFAYRFTIRDENNALHDPATLQVSFKKGDATEDVLTLGGVQPRDSQLTKLSTGVYRVDYKLDVLGDWLINERWTDDGWGHPIKGRDMPITVIADPHAWVDTP
jgi:hypothetical protein